MGNGCSKLKTSPPREGGIVLPQKNTEMAIFNQANNNQTGAIEAIADDDDLDEEEDEDDEEENSEDDNKEHVNTQARLKEWFRCFAEETDGDRRGVQTWARLCMWRYFWDFLFEVSFNEKLTDIERWGRVVPSVYQRHLYIKRLAEHTLKKMEKKHRDKVFHQLAIFSDLQGPDIYWDEDLRATGIDGLNMDEVESIDDMKTLTSHFGALTVDLFKENTLPIRGKWVSANYTGDIDAMDDDNQESSDYVVLSLSKEGWDDLKLITQINVHPRVKKLRAARQKIRMLHGRTVTVLMKNCVRCTAPMVEGVSQSFVEGLLELNEHLLSKTPEQIIDYSPSFKFKLRNLNTGKIERCGRRCQGNISASLTELDPDQFFIGSLLTKNAVAPNVVSAWEAALRRRRTCGLSLHFYSTLYANKDMPKESVDTWKKAVQKSEGARSDLYQLMFEGSRPKLTKAIHELYRRMQSICAQPDRSYWFKFWVTACKALFPNSSSVPDDKWDFDFVNNQKAICYQVMEREPLEELIKKSKIFDNASLYLSKNHSLEKVLDSLFKNLANMKLRNAAEDYHADVTDEQLNNPLQQQQPSVNGAPSLPPGLANGLPSVYPPGMMMSPGPFAMSPSMNYQGSMMGGMMSPMMNGFSMPPPHSLAPGTPMMHSMGTPGMGPQGGINLNSLPSVDSPNLSSFGVPIQGQHQSYGQQQSSGTTVIFGATPQNTEEYNQVAVQAQEVMKKLLGIQAGVARGSLTKEEAHKQMAALALQHPVLLNAIGGSDSVNVLRNGSGGSGGNSSRRRDSVQGEEETVDEISMSPPSRSTSKNSGKASRSDADADDSEDDMPRPSARPPRRPINDDEDEDDEYYNNLSEANVKAKHEGFSKLAMKLPSMKGRMCGTVSDNGVDVPDAEQPEDPDACTIM